MAFIMFGLLSIPMGMYQDRKGRKHVLLLGSLAALIGIFLYVGPEVSMSAKIPNYLEAKLNFDIKEKGLFGALFFFISLMTGRFLGGVVLNWLSPKKFLVLSTLLSIVGIAALFFVPNQVFAFVVIFIIGLGFANIFPLIFSMAVDALPDRSNEISGIMITAIIGGAFVPMMFGGVAELFGLMAGFFLLAICMLYIFLITFKSAKV